jgi:hypothetical protein
MDIFHIFVSEPEIMWTTQTKFCLCLQLQCAIKVHDVRHNHWQWTVLWNSVSTEFHLNSLECMEEEGINLFTH